MAKIININNVNLTDTFNAWRLEHNNVTNELNKADTEAVASTIVHRDQDAGFNANNIVSDNQLIRDINGDSLRDNLFPVDFDSVSDNYVMIQPGNTATLVVNNPNGTLRVPVVTKDITDDNNISGYDNDGFVRFDTVRGFEGLRDGVWSSLGGVTDNNQDTFIVANTAQNALRFYTIAPNASPHNEDLNDLRWEITNSGDLIPGGASGSYDVGSSSRRVEDIYAEAINITGDINIGGNIVTAGSAQNLSAVSLVVSDKNIALGLVANTDGLPHTGTINATDAGAPISNTSFALEENSRYWISSIANSTASIEGLYLHSGGHFFRVFPDGGIGPTHLHELLHTADPTIPEHNIEFYGPQTDVTISGGGVTVVGTTEHAIEWNTNDNMWETFDGMEFLSNDAIRVPTGSGAQRPDALSVNRGQGLNFGNLRGGLIRFNTDINSFEGTDSSGIWVGLGGLVDSTSHSDTFISVYGASNPTDNAPSAADITNGSGRLDRIRFFVGRNSTDPAAGSVEKVSFDTDQFTVFQTDNGVRTGEDKFKITNGINSELVYNNEAGHSVFKITENEFSVAPDGLDSRLLISNSTTTIFSSAIRLRNGSEADNRILRCGDSAGTTTWVDFGVFDSAGTRLF